MKRTTLRNLIASATIATAALVLSSRADAVPINGQYFEDPRCDTLPNQFLQDELGDAAVFPINESIIYQTPQATFTVCVPDDGLANDWIVQMTNVSGIAWTNLFFVVDDGGTFGNADGVIADLAGPAPQPRTDAMRIDGTVTLGINNNLLNESGVVDEIFSPGETWRFNVSNFMVINAAGGFSPPIFNTPGKFAGTSPLGAGNPGNASILANPVPEPSAIMAVGALVGAMLLRRPGRQNRN